MSLTVSEILGAGDALGAALDEHPEILQGLGGGLAMIAAPLGLGDVGATLKPALDTIMQLDIPGLLVGAWEEAGVLTEYADPELHDPDETHLVPLSDHAVIAEYEPTVHFSYDKLPIEAMSLTLQIAIEIRIEGLLVVVRGGRALEMRAGRVQVHVKAARGELVLMDTESAWLDLKKGIALGEEGIPLVSEEAGAGEDGEGAPGEEAAGEEPAAGG